MNLDLNRLRTLLAVAHYGSMSAAARALHYSPSAVSQQLTTLEAEVEAPVLERIGRGIRLTPVGQVLVEHAEVLLNDEQQACTAVEQVRESRAAELSVGVFATVAAGLIPDVLADLAEHHPRLRLRTREVDPEDAIVDLRQGRLDLAFLLDYPDAPRPWPANLSMRMLTVDHLYLAAPAGTIKTSGAVDLVDLADLDWIISGPHTHYGRAVQAACQKAGADLRITHQVDMQATALSMVGAGLGITLMSDLGHPFLPAGVETFELRPAITRRVLIAHHRALDHRPALQSAIESIARAADRLAVLKTAPATGN